MLGMRNKYLIKFKDQNSILSKIELFGQIVKVITSISSLLYTANCSKIVYEIKFKYGSYSI